jgi:osmotically-inducible protein OsmY
MGYRDRVRHGQRSEQDFGYRRDYDRLGESRYDDSTPTRGYYDESRGSRYDRGYDREGRQERSLGGRYPDERYEQDWDELDNTGATRRAENYYETRGRSYGQRYDRRASREDPSRGERYGRLNDPSFSRSSEWGYGPSSEQRGWWDKASDEVSSWFGDEEAERRRLIDRRRGGSYRGRGPKGYRRSDERIKEDVNDRLTDNEWLDATDIDVQVSNCDVVLSGTVHDRYSKRLAEEIADEVSGVRNVENRIRVVEMQEHAPATETSVAHKSKSTTTSNT